MNFGLILLVLLAALLHATWNALAKKSTEPLFGIGSFRLFCALAAACFIPFVGLPAPESWGLLVLSVLVHSVYYFTGEWLKPQQWFAVLLISLALLSLALQRNLAGRVTPQALAWGLTTSLLIACYTVVDGAGVRIAGGLASAVAYGLVIFAMSLGTIALVSSLRETGVLFAALIGTLFLKEQFGQRRIFAACMVVTGAVLIRLSN